MTIKREIKKVLGDVEEHKQNVWRKLQQPKRKNRPPVIVAFVAIVLACFILAINLAPYIKKDAVETSQFVDSTNNGQTLDATEYPFTVLYEGNDVPAYLNSEYTMLMATTDEELKEYLSYYKIKTPEVDFDKHFVIIAQFPSDGCGLVVDRISSDNNMLHIKLDLPLELRKNNEIACTAILQRNISIVQLDKFAGYEKLETGTIIVGSQETKTQLNVVEKDDLLYNFEYLIDPSSIESLEFYTTAQPSTTITDKQIIEQLSSAYQHFEVITGISDMIDPKYKIAIKTTDGHSLKIHLWFDTISPTVTVRSERNDYQIYKVPREMMLSIIEQF